VFSADSKPLKAARLQIPAHFVLPASLIPPDLVPKRTINLGRHDEIALGQTINLVGPKRDFRLSPGKQDVRMVALFLSYFPNPIYERQRLFEVRKSEGPGEVVLIDYLPMRPVRQLLMNFSQFLAF
jgi:hypothetical protein